MSYTMADYRFDTAKEYFEELTPEKRRELLGGLTPEKQREVLRGLKPEVLRGLSLEERFAGLSAEEIAEYLRKLKSKRPSRKGRPRRKH